MDIAILILLLINTYTTVALNAALARHVSQELKSLKVELYTEMDRQLRQQDWRVSANELERLTAEFEAEMIELKLPIKSKVKVEPNKVQEIK